MSWRQSVLETLAAQRAPLWVFGYGSLMWRPDFPHLELRDARLYGFHRAPCIYSFHHRGTEQNPGLVMGLDNGGSCKGRALRVAAKDAAGVLDYLNEREMISGVYAPSLHPVHLGDGKVVTALCFAAVHDHVQYAGRLDFDSQVALVRKGVGPSGKCIDYFSATVEHLDELGIPDGPLHRLVAAALDEVD